MKSQDKKNELEFFLIGDSSWTNVRETLIMLLERARTPNELNNVIKIMILGCAQSVSELQENRKRLNLKSLTKNEIKSINKKIK